ncbi:hypothetical protein EA004_19670 [Vibrio anguillarum]|uniref:Phage abortive infection protein n=2 Tax=Vibrio anguillarum TaxID=55601 RepID=A0ABR9Z8Z7_VIBAN|nr:hypothetical protein [Vibrio vulnificus]MBF4247190.1 hypothetical protein [Vibrio anguillarum]MBF4374912.1 hypothetical protein [Vibrio anguillarum]MBF4453437.1 hypothetical protein [Vibrio vulnificus]MBF4499194.1 hypothetical protein [Vibrio vulnificus]MBL6179129.1 hypothetical protein [Vibrio vulnificus]
MKFKVLLALCFLVLATPILFYIYQFGFGLWSEHSDWASMGSALGGLYTPILALLTLAVLVKQLQIQAQSRDYEQRETSRKLVFDMVEKFAQKIEERLDDELRHNLYVLSEMPKGHPDSHVLKSGLMDIFTLWTSVRAYTQNYSKREPQFSVDLLAIPVLHLDFRVCYDIEKAYITHISEFADEVAFYQFD